MSQRQIVLDTETTGLDPAQGHRIIEIGCLELVNRRLTQRHFHHYLEPDREIDEDAERVHGISRAFLKGKPRFADIAEDFLAFVDGAELVIHNAAFDVGFINAELERLGHAPIITRCSVLDTLLMARQKHPGQKNNLDALARRYGVDNRERTLHGALLDSEILADVYLAMTGGQVGLHWGQEDESSGQGIAEQEVRRVSASRPALRVVAASVDELAAHQAYLEKLDSKSPNQQSVFRRYE